MKKRGGISQVGSSRVNVHKKGSDKTENKKNGGKRKKNGWSTEAEHRGNKR